MKLLIFILFTLSVTLTKQQKITPIQKQYVFIPQIQQNYSIAAQIYNKIHDEQIQKTRPKQIIQTTPTITQQKNVMSKFMGFANQAKVTLSPPIPTLINLKSPQQFAIMPTDISADGTINSINYNNDKKNNPFLQPPKQLKMSKQIDFLEERQQVQFNEEKIFEINNIAQNSVIQQNGNIVKVSLTRSPKTAIISTNTNTNTNTNNNNYQQQKPQNLKSNLIPIEKQQQFQIPNLRQNKLQPSKITKRIQDKQTQTKTQKQTNLQINEINEIQIKQDQARILKFIFTGLLVIAIIFIIFSTNTRHHDSQLMQVKDDEQNQLK